MEKVVAGEEAALGVDSAAGKDVGQKIAAEALGLQGVVGVVAGAVQAGDVVLGEIHVGLPHNGDDVDLFVRGDVRVLILGQEGGGVRLIVAPGGELHKIAEAVEKGVDAAVGNVALGGAQLVQVLVVLEAVVAVLTQVEGGQGGGDEKSGGRGGGPAPPAGDPAPDQEKEEKRP